jgi:hypothetical protein
MHPCRLSYSFDVLIFVAFEGIPTRCQGVKHVGIFISTRFTFHLVKTPLGFEWGIHGFGDGIYGLVLGLHTHKENII